MSVGTIELQVLSYAGGEAEVGQSVRLGYSPVSIGRSPACHLSLQDPERLISRSHLSAWLDAQGRAWIRNSSSSTPVFVEGRELSPGAQAPLSPGQQLVLGRYLLAARSVVGSAADSIPPAVAGAASEGAWAPPSTGFAPIPDEFDVFAAPAAVGPASGGSATACALDEFSGDRDALSDVFSGLPQFDPRGPSQLPELPELVAQGGVQRAQAPADPLAQLLGESGSLLADIGSAGDPGISEAAEHGSEIDALFRMPVAAAVPVPAIPTPVASSRIPAPELDPLALDLGGSPEGGSAEGLSLLDLIATPEAAVGTATPVPTAPPAPSTGAPAVERHPAAAMPASLAPGSAGGPASGATSGPVIPPAATPPRTQSAGAAGSAPAAARAQPPAAGSGPPPAASAPGAAAAPGNPGPVDSDAAALAAAFARGCGLQPNQIGTLDAADFESLGRMFHSLVAGTLQLIHARSSTKHELRAQMTMIATSGNNPLKFAPDAQAAMLQLVGRGLPGFMPPVEAVRDAFADLSAHQVGLVSASRSAMYAMAGRLSPEHIQQRLGGPRGFSGLLPSGHKAQLWDAYVAAHAQLLGEAREEFDAAFQGAFVDAYEGEVRRVQSGGGL